MDGAPSGKGERSCRGSDRTGYLSPFVGSSPTRPFLLTDNDPKVCVWLRSLVEWP